LLSLKFRSKKAEPLSVAQELHFRGSKESSKRKNGSFQSQGLIRQIVFRKFLSSTRILKYSRCSSKIQFQSEIKTDLPTQLCEELNDLDNIKHHFKLPRQMNNHQECLLPHFTSTVQYLEAAEILYKSRLAL